MISTAVPLQGCDIPHAIEMKVSFVHKQDAPVPAQVAGFSCIGVAAFDEAFSNENGFAIFMLPYACVAKGLIGFFTYD
jgi:hypothetical protein